MTVSDGEKLANKCACHLLMYRKGSCNIFDS